MGQIEADMLEKGDAGGSVAAVDKV